MGFLKSISTFISEARRRRRLLVLCPARLSKNDGMIADVDLVNVSVGGAMLYCANPPALDSHVTLHWAERSDPALVVWVKGRRCGIKFERDVPASAILQAAA